MLQAVCGQARGGSVCDCHRLHEKEWDEVINRQQEIKTVFV